MIGDPIAQRLREAVWADPNSDAPRMVAQVDKISDTTILQLEVASTAQVTKIVSGIAELAGARNRIVVEDLRDSNHCIERHVELPAELYGSFTEVVVTSGPIRLRAP